MNNSSPIFWLIVVGCVLITIGTLATVLAGIFRPQRTRRGQPRWTYRHILFWVVLIGGPILVGAGTLLTIEGAQRNAVLQANRAEETQKKTREENARANREINEKMQEMLLAVRAAKQEETRHQTEEKISMIEDNLNQWVEDFEKRRPEKERQLEQSKQAALQKELQISSESTALFSYVLAFVQKALRAYADKGHKLRIDLSPPPDNFYAREVNSVERSVRFAGGKAQWTFSFQASQPAREDQAPQLYLSCSNAEGQSGQIYIAIIPKTGRFSINGGGILPSPDAQQAFGQYALEKKEDAIKLVFQPLIEAQLTETP